MPFTLNTENKKEIRSITYQKFVRDFIRSGASIDDNIVKLLDYLEKENLIENTVIIYTSDQGYFLGNMVTWIKGGFMKNLLECHL